MTPWGPTRQRWSRLLGGIATIFGRADAMRIALHVLLSLVAAVSGSIAALVLVPLIQPGHAPMFGGHELALPESRGVLVGMLLLATGAYALLRWIVARLAARVIGDCTVRLRTLVHARLMRAELAALTGSTSAEVANVLTANVTIIAQGVGASLQLLVASVTTAVSLVFAFWVSPVLTVVLPALAGLALIASRWQGRQQARVSHQYVADMTSLFRLSENFPGRLRHIRSFEREDAEQSGYGDVSAGLGRGYRRQIELAASGKLLMELLAAIGIAGIFMLAGRWRGMDQASLIAVGMLLGRLLPYLASTRYNVQQLHLAAPALKLWQRYASLRASQLAGPPADDERGVPRIHIERMRAYAPPCRLDIESLQLLPGEITLITGDSGAGKSTLADLLAGMTAPAEFTARIGRRPISFAEYRQLVRRGAYLGQHVLPWQRTVRECLHWVAPDASDERLGEVLAQVGLAKRFRRAQDGLDAELDGLSCRLSGGELQRLMMAQIVLRQPALAILDEATGALDAASEMTVLAVLKRCLPQTILIVVAHRRGPADLAEQCLHIGEDGRATVARRSRAGVHGFIAARADEAG